ncbi:anthranilate synthase component I family protein [Salinibacterium sp. ZJ70]|uniref:anthranilate synthase component I family protein n=1 Tax=Salinibacterium sp. ZJ70 TaxID=2708084 RepID=UPI0014209ECF|nr:anthranilate synthase component I family protein [Salinibacterium sp. ZJ70]
MRPGLVRHQLSGVFEAARLFDAMHPEGDAFWLDSGQAGRAFLGTGERIALPQGEVLPRLRAELAAMSVPSALGRVPLGVVGWFGYELREETTGEMVRERGPLPDAAFLRVDRLIEVHPDGTAALLALGDAWTGELAAWRDQTASLAVAAMERPRPAHRAGRITAEPVWRDDPERYLESVRACQAAIHEGEAYQLCLTSEVRVAGSFDARAVFDAVRATGATHHGGLIRIGESSLVSASPERFLEVDADGLVQTSPIKGTRPRHPDPDEDARLADELLASEKERAENLMIVDLMRNDLSRVCETGSVAVTRLHVVEPYPRVHQLVSTIQGRLRPAATAIDAVAACFPAGSMTGAPKLRAVRILDELEQRPRGPYAGAFGYLAADGSADLAMTIRTIVIDPDGATVGAGGGITALSVPEEELAEARLKAAALLDDLAASVQPQRE